MARLAAARFPNFTHAELALLEFADIGNLDRGEIAVAGTSAAYSDPSNDPAHAESWSADRNIRADLIRWLLVDRRAIELEDPVGIRVLGARIVGGLKLGHIHTPVSLMLRKCSIPEEIVLSYAELPELSLNGSYTSEIYAPKIKVNGALQMGQGFHAAGPIDMSGGSEIAGDAEFSGGHFNLSRGSPRYFGVGGEIVRGLRGVLILTYAQINGLVNMCCGFEAQGAVLVTNSSIHGSFTGWGSRFINPNSVTLALNEAKIVGGVSFSDANLGIRPPHTSEFNGFAVFSGAEIGGSLDFTGAKFTGAPSEQHGLLAQAMNVKEAMVWQKVALTNDAFLDLGGAQVGNIADDVQSWPKPGQLRIDELRYQGLGLPNDVTSRLRWVALNAPPSPQPYDQLAKFYRNHGSNSQADQVLIERDDVLYSNSDGPHYAWGKFLKITIGYGHQPLRAIIWSIMVVAVGTAMVAAGKRAGVMRLTWPETTPPPASDLTEELNPVLYSFDVFLPFVNFHQEHYWWPDAGRTGHCSIFGRRIRFSGSVLRYYLWAQITAGWLLSAIFLAGVTGLIRND